MSNFAILRIAKLRAPGNVASSAAHILRERNAPNADPARRKLNRHEGADTAAEVLARVKELAARSERKSANGDEVLALEYLVTASPKAFHKGGSLAGSRCKRYLDAALDWIKARHVDGCVVLAETHMDEKSPHMQVIVVPLFEVAAHTRKFSVRAAGGGRQVIERDVPAHTVLSARRYVDGRAMLSAMQTDFARQVGERFGLKRGIERSGAEHTTIKTFYGAANRVAARMANGAALPEPSVFDWTARAVGFKTDRMKQAEAHRADQARAAELAVATAPALRRQAARLNARQDELDLRESEISAQQQAMAARQARDAGLKAQAAQAAQEAQEAQAADKSAQEVRREAARREASRCLALLLKAAYSRAELFKRMGRTMPSGKADIFDLLVQAREASDFAEAVEIVAGQCPPESGSRWDEVAELIGRHDAEVPDHDENDGGGAPAAPNAPGAAPGRVPRSGPRSGPFGGVARTNR